MIHLLDNPDPPDVPPDWGQNISIRVGGLLPEYTLRHDQSWQVGWGGGSWHNKGSRERAGCPGWSHHTKSCLLPGETLHHQQQLKRECKTNSIQSLYACSFISAITHNRLANTFSRGSCASNLVFPVCAYFKYFVPNFQKFSAPPSKDSQLNAAFAMVGSCKVCK